MSDMFSACYKLTSLDVSNWDTSNVTDMSEMFVGCQGLASLDASNWDTSKVTTMSYMFHKCSSLTTLDVSNWDTSNVTTMYYMFFDCSNLQTITGIINLESCTDYAEMLNNTNNLYIKIKLPNNISEDDFIKYSSSNGKDNIIFVKEYNFDGTYGPIPNEDGEVDLSYYASKYIANYDNIVELPDVNKEYLKAVFNTGDYINKCKVNNTSHAFDGCNNITKDTFKDFDVFDLSSIDSIDGMFANTSSLKDLKVKLDITGINDEKEDNIGNNNLIFVYDNWRLDRDFKVNSEEAMDEIWKYGPIPNSDGTVDLSNYAYSYIIDYQNITELPKRNKEYLDEVLTTGKYKVTNMSNMFGYNNDKEILESCSSLTSLDVSKWDTSNVTNMSYMFAGCSSLTSLDTSNWDISNVTNMMAMFNGCESLISLDVSVFDTSKVTNMSGMFSGCLKLTSFDVSNWDTSNVTDMYGMFAGCSSLTSLDVSNWDTSKVTNMFMMFAASEQLKNIIGTIDLSSCSSSGRYYRMLAYTNSLTSINIKLPSTISQEDFLTGSAIPNVDAVHFVS